MTCCGNTLRTIGLSLAVALGVLGPSPSRAQDLAAGIRVAVEKGRRFLLPRLAEQVRSPDSGYPMGHLGLYLAAVLKAGTPVGDPVVQGAMERLDGLPIRRTYSVACYLFALDAYWQAKYRESLRRARSSERTAVGEAVPNVPPDGPIRSKMKELVDWLVRGSGGTWSYTGRGLGDHSNTQFAILGLDIGLQNGIPVPLEVFRAIAEHFVATHSPTQDSRQFAVTFKTPAWEGITTGVSRRTSFVAYPGGWHYHSSGPAGQRQTMTAAGVSSLLVARRALERAGEYQGQLAWDVDRRIESGLGWMAEYWPQYTASYRWSYYGLYSVEKAGDIGGIVSFGSVNWYVEGAQLLLDRQRPDGSWGDDVDTAFALLFLTRATRSHLQTLGPPVLFTRVGEGGSDGESDLVYIDQLKGFVAASSIFDFLAETRDPKVIPIAEEAIRGFPPDRLHDALAHVLVLWKEPEDTVTRFAQRAAADIAQVSLADRAAYDQLVKDFRRARELGRATSPDAEELSRLLARARSPALKRRLIDVVDRTGAALAFGTVIECLTDGDPEVRRRAHETLRVWTGKSFPAPPEPSNARRDVSPALLEDAARPWRKWWSEEAESFRKARGALELVERLNQARDPGDVEKLLADLVSLGKPAVPSILDAMERPGYSVHLVRALEAITARSAGLRARDWRRALGD